MTIPHDLDAELERLPAILRALLDAELAAGNAIVEIGHGFPSPPVGAWVMLARAVSTRPRQAGDGLTFRTRNWNNYSFEWSDAQGYFFLLEPPLPPEPPPDMDAIRARHAISITPMKPPPESPPVAPGEYTVDVDYRGEMLTYREADRQADVICTWGSRPTIARRTLSNWWYRGENRRETMSEADRQMVLDRIVDYAARRGLGKVKFED